MAPRQAQNELLPFIAAPAALREAVMQQKERRAQLRRSAVSMQRELSEAQSLALVGLEHFGWELKFIRRPLFQEPVAVVSDGTSMAVLDRDGQLVEQVPLKVRH